MSGFFADQAAVFASTDRVEHADRLMDVACQEAVGIMRLGARTGDPWAWLEANRVLATAERRASRILGPAPAAVAVPVAGAGVAS